MENPRTKALVAALALAGGAAVAQPPPPAASTPLSPRNANYSIDARLEPATRLLTGRQVLSWRNLRETPTGELRFHLYWNAFRNDQSTWLREDRLRGRSDVEDPEDDDWGYLVVDGIRLVDGGPAPDAAALPSDLAPDRLVLAGAELPARYEAPDDGNPHDRTVLVVDLPRPVGPGETVDVELEWRAKVPRTFARTGVRGEYYFVAHWFPKLGVYEDDGWSCRQFHAATEFYSDYGSYDVRLTLPDRFVVGATGREVERAAHGDGTTTHRYVQDDVHAFTWTASPDYLVREARFEVHGLPPVDLRLLYQGERAHQAERHLDATRAALEHYGKWYGAYPYGHVTIVDPAWGSGAGGMEYPTLFTAGTRISRPFGGGSPEKVTIHEAGHQFWYGIVGNDEFEHAWLDEGLNTFSTARAYEAAYGESRYTKSYLDPPGTDLGGFVTVLFGDVRESRAVDGNRWGRFVRNRAATAGPQSDPTYRYFPPRASDLSYAKTSLWLATLERHLGWDALQGILSTFFERWKFRHPRPEDFFAVADEVAGQDLGWFFDQVYGSSVAFDYAVDSVKSSPVFLEGFVEGEAGELELRSAPKDGDGDEDDDARLYRTEVVVRRHGEGVFPLELLLVYADGRESRHAWDGRERWKLFVEEGPAKLDYAALDPERVLLLDLDYSNNSLLRKPRPDFASRKWAAAWMVWLQDFLSAFTFFV
ncbi:MAG TPA: M1 family metallopeptidase [Thermoanaerobaculia bacterium]|jgi:hypothetical protein